MALTLAYDAAQERQYQARLEAGQKLAEAGERIEAELIATFLAGCNGYPVRVPFTETTSEGLRHEREQSVPEAMFDLLDDCVAMGLLMTTLRESTCPHVIAMKRIWAERYAKQWAERIAEARADHI
jgi:hypothetical protein